MGGRKQGKTQGTAYQRGAVAIWVGVSIVAMMTATFLAIETGRLYFAQRDLQRMANLAAVAGVQAASGCAGANSNGTLGSLDDITTLVQNFIVANGGEATTLIGINGYDPVELGHMVSQGDLRVFSPLPAGDRNITSVRVNLRKARPTPFSGFLTGGGDLIASATAEQPAIASFRLGTTLLTLNQGALNQLLTGLLGASVNLTVANYQGLLGATVSLQDLMVAAGVTDLSQLLTLQTNLPGALGIAANALGAAGSEDAAALLTGLAGISQSSSSGNMLADVLNNLGTTVNPGVNDALAGVPLIDGLGLLTALGEAASKGGPISLPITGGIPGVTSYGVFLKIIDPEQPALGPAGIDADGEPFTSAKSSQITLQVRLGLPLEIKTGLPLIGTITLASVRLGLDVGVANGYSRLLSIDCPGLNHPNAEADIETTTSTITATVGAFDGSASAKPPQPLKSGNIVDLVTLVKINATINPKNIPGTSVTQTATGPFPPSQALPTIDSTGNLAALINSVMASNLTLVVGFIPLPIDLVLIPLSPVIALLDSIIDGLLQALGIGVGESGVTVVSIDVPQARKVSVCIPGGPTGAGERGCP